MEQNNNNLTKYEFEFNGKILKMHGRPWVPSDHDIIAMVFMQKMFSTERMAQNHKLNRYYDYLISNNCNPTLIDAGANIGAASLYFNQMYPVLKTISIEPDIENARLLQTNLAEFDVEIIQGALGSDDEILFLDTKNFDPIAYRVGSVGNIEVISYSVTSILKRLTSIE